MGPIYVNGAICEVLCLGIENGMRPGLPLCKGYSLCHTCLVSFKEKEKFVYLQIYIISW